MAGSPAPFPVAKTEAQVVKQLARSTWWPGTGRAGVRTQAYVGLDADTYNSSGARLKTQIPFLVAKAGVI